MVSCHKQSAGLFVTDIFALASIEKGGLAGFSGDRCGLLYPPAGGCW